MIPHFPRPGLPTYNASSNLWGFNSLGYNWWDYAQEKQSDTKVGRIAYNLAGQLVRDRLKNDKTTKIKLIDFATDGDLGLMLESLGFKLDILRGGHEITFFLTNNKLDAAEQVVIINSLYQAQPKEAFQNLSDFVSEGGRILLFNSAPTLAGMIFQGKLQNGPHSVCVGAKLKLNTSEKDIFSAFGSSEEVVLEYGRYPPSVSDNQHVTVLAKVSAKTPEPVLLKITHGNGVGYLFLSKMFLKEKEDLPDMKVFFADKGVAKETIAAWDCAINVGFKNAVALAIAAYPSMEMIAKIILREHAYVEQLQAVALQQQDNNNHGYDQMEQHGMTTYE